MIVTDDLVFIENPKTGCTSVRVMIENLGGRTVGSKHWNLRDYNDKNRRRLRVTTVRNPFDRMVSGFHFQTGGKMDFKKWMLGDDWEVAPGIDFKRVSQLHWTVQCNVIMRFETLHEDVEKLRKRLDLPEARLPHMHKSNDRRPYQDYYDDETRAVIEDRFKIDMKVFGYTF